MVRVVNFYINSSLHVAFSALAFTVITTYELGLYIHSFFYVFVFCGVVAVYNTAKYYNNRPPKEVVIITLLAYAVSGCLCAWLSLKCIAICLLVFVACVLYIKPVHPFKYELRQHGILKVFTVSMCWSITTVLIPVLESVESCQGFYKTDLSKLALYMLSRFILVIVLIIPFEIEDLGTDRLKWKTIPQKIGLKNSKYLAYLLLALYWAVLENLLISTLVTLVLVALGIYFCRQKRHSYHSRLWVEGIPILQLVFVFVEHQS